ncbi:L-histidine N(alpha)-methyltransferase [Sorangium sp. So ce1000]|uniref:L-histidine N(alpha)-methyltransferase n=1 Tax=Sorangium sp. So ce1000 TaxID=3133325 RepID=UPI003F623CA6
MSSTFAEDAYPSPDECARLRESLTRSLPEIPPVYFYDDLGSELFEQITHLGVYYPTRTEIGILDQRAGDILRAVRPRRLVELGSGAGRKIRILLDAWRWVGGGETCTMLDVNGLFLETSISRLRTDYPEYTFRGVIGDFTTDLPRLGRGGGRLVVFLAGTIGNLYPDERRAFFREVARVMEPSDALLVGADLVKDTARLEAAYDDPEGVTAAFNRNALRVINRRFGANFAPDAFAHRAFYDAARAWIEMRLVASRRMRVQIPALDLRLDLERGAEIRTEVSCKFTRDSLQASARAGGLVVSSWHTDPNQLFALALLRRSDA